MCTCYSNYRTLDVEPMLVTNDVELPFDSKHKYLGITFVINFSWLPYISTLCLTLSSKLFLLSRNAQFQNACLMRLIYTSLIEPRSRYMALCFGVLHHALTSVKFSGKIMSNTYTSLSKLNNIWYPIHLFKSLQVFANLIFTINSCNFIFVNLNPLQLQPVQIYTRTTQKCFSYTDIRHTDLSLLPRFRGTKYAYEIKLEQNPS